MKILPALAPTKNHLVSWEYTFPRSRLHVLRPRLGVEGCQHSTGLTEKAADSPRLPAPNILPPTLLVAIEDRRLKPVAYLSNGLKLYTQQKTALSMFWRRRRTVFGSPAF